MTTLLIIASMALTVSLFAIVILLGNTLIKTINTRSRQLLETQDQLDRMITCFEPISRNIHGRIAKSFSLFTSLDLAKIDANRFKDPYNDLSKDIMEEICDAISQVIKLELEYRPQYLNIDVKMNFTTQKVEIDFSYPFILYPGANLLRSNFSKVLTSASPYHFTNPSIIKKHF